MIKIKVYSKMAKKIKRKAKTKKRRENNRINPELELIEKRLRKLSEKMDGKK